VRRAPDVVQQRFYLILGHEVHFVDHDEPVPGEHRDGLRRLDDLVAAMLPTAEDVEIQSFFLGGKGSIR
jgi:hypothetical protein